MGLGVLNESSSFYMFPRPRLRRQLLSRTRPAKHYWVVAPSRCCFWHRISCFGVSYCEEDFEGVGVGRVDVLSRPVRDSEERC